MCLPSDYALMSGSLAPEISSVVTKRPQKKILEAHKFYKSKLVSLFFITVSFHAF